METNRNKIAQEYKWNLDDIYPNWNEWEKDLIKLKKIMEEVPKYEGRISKNSETFIEFINLEERVSRLLDKVYLYPYLQRDLDSTNENASVKLQEIENIYANYSISSSWITPEILTIPKETMIKWIDENDSLHSNKFPLMEIYRLQEHVLSADKERLLSYFGQYLGVPSDIYSELSTSDIKWNEIELNDGSKATVTNGVYSKIVSTNRLQEDRRKAFEALYNSFNINKNTYAAIYKSILQRDFATAQSRNYKSSLQKALNPKNIPLDVYKTLVESTRENTAPLKRYISLRKKALELENYHYYDNSINLVHYNKDFSYEEAKEIVLESVKPLGEEYYSGLNTALSKGWLDVYETSNKRSGAYSLNIYDVHPYMLLNYNGTMDAVFTLAHELGHTMHSMLSTKNQPYPISSYTI
ncbi:MAG: M3 family oligoendopeptidase, partial [Cetobacterium sp.]